MPILSRVYFPDPQKTPKDGLVAVSDTIEQPLLHEAYSFGIFPWPQDGLPILWFSPDPRGVLLFEDLHLPKSFRRFANKTQLSLTMNLGFEDVIAGCRSANRPDQEGTWISESMMAAYIDFHKNGFAHSVEVWAPSGELVGGLYGVFVGGVFAGESMFHRVPNASKLALFGLIQFLKLQGHNWMDIQMVTPLLSAWGGKYVKRDDYFSLFFKTKQNARGTKFKNSVFQQIFPSKDQTRNSSPK